MQNRGTSRQRDADAMIEEARGDQTSSNSHKIKTIVPIKTDKKSHNSGDQIFFDQIEQLQHQIIVGEVRNNFNSKYPIFGDIIVPV